jgi:hypothetical protein
MPTYNQLNEQDRAAIAAEEAQQAATERMAATDPVR